MPERSAASVDLLGKLRRLAILTPAQLAEVPQHGDAQALARDLVRRGWLTPFQANLLLQGRAADLVIAHYLLFERVGQGGTGDVYKARHQHMERIVALKVIKKDLVSDADVMARFLREVKIASQLVHPNVVHAYDAGPWQGNYFLAMEFIAGTDLFRLVKDRGALPHRQAGDYIRQAALGLQHVHERGLVHRDVKPSNLLLTDGGAIKILDLGLARLRQPKVGEAPGQITGPGATMMGTLDYMAPEQAIDFGGADIRADIYSLGCTFYFLLTGGPPFGECTVAEKLLRHQQAEPKAVEQGCADLPAHAAQVVRRMMAKAPKDRYPTPAAVAEALAVPAAVYLPVAVPSRLPAPAAGAPHAVVVLDATGAPVRWQSRLSWPQRLPRSRRGLLLGAVGVGLASLVLCFGCFGTSRPPTFLADLDAAEVTGTRREGHELFTRRGRHSISGKPAAISVGPDVFANGLYTPVASGQTTRLRYPLGKQFRTFRTGVGTDNAGRKNVQAPVFFTVIGDRNVLWKSGPLTKPGEREDSPRLNVAGIEMLELVVTWPAGRRESLFEEELGHYAVWLDPRLTD